MKQVAAFVILIALLAQLGNRYMLMLNYELNKNYIAQNLCVNRNKPMSGCNGKCYLKKQLAKASNEENTPGSNTRVDKNEAFFLTGIKTITAYFFAIENDLQFIQLRQAFTPQNLFGKIFHPPQAA